jgi:hypothetical protein
MLRGGPIAQSRRRAERCRESFPLSTEFTAMNTSKEPRSGSAGAATRQEATVTKR